MARVAVLLALAMSGCALFPISEADCKPASWRQKGYDDGYFGNSPQHYRLIAECPRFGIKVDQEQYLAGWRDGHDEWDRLMGSMDFM